jgi:chorismate mutase
VTESVTAQPEPAGATTEANGTAAETGTHTGTDTGTDTDSLIAGKRRRIDDLDARVIALVGERMALSAEIQTARIGSGGRRLHLNREMEVLRTYGEALGKPGTALGMTLLELCRGRV